MSEFRRDCLRMLRIFGPCSNADVARRLKVPSHQTYPALCWLTEAGYAAHPKLQRWQITELGLEVFEKQPNKPLTLFQE